MEFIGQIIGEFIIVFLFTFIYKLIIQPILITLGVISVLMQKCVKKDVKSLNEIDYEALEKEGGDLIIGSMVIILLVLIIGMIVYFGFYMFDN
jgi:uncharacterized membrane protein